MTVRKKQPFEEGHEFDLMTVDHYFTAGKKCAFQFVSLIYTPNNAALKFKEFSGKKLAIISKLHSNVPDIA